ncbi:hypothetical protein B0H13DRAFT_1132005 [Mycena leptocephala]|nr:hypothetical protein B0H13DRAFT_1132005 [Mycena leptocephala]
MQWFRKGRRSVTVSGGLTPSPFSPAKHEAAASSVEVASVPHKSAPQPQQSPFLVTPGTSEHRQRTTSAVSITSLFRRSTGVSNGNNKAALRVHHGAVDHEMITAGRPPEVMQHMREVLSGMGVDIQVEGDFKYRCTRPAKRRDRRTSSTVLCPAEYVLFVTLFYGEFTEITSASLPHNRCSEPEAVCFGASCHDANLRRPEPHWLIILPTAAAFPPTALRLLMLLYTVTRRRTSATKSDSLWSLRAWTG